MTEDADTLMLLLRVGFSLAVVFVLIWISARIVKRRNGASGSKASTQQIEIVERRSVGKRSSLMLLRVGGKAVLVGTTDQHIELLAEAPHLDTRDDDITVVELPSVAPVDLADVRRERAVGLVRPDGTRAPHTSQRPSRLSLADAMREMTTRRV